MERETKDGFLSPDATLQEVRKELLRVAAEIRRFGAGQQADRLEAAERALEPPRLKGVLMTVAAPRTWLTREYAMWLATQIMTAADLIHEFMEDAEIVGSERTITKAQEWLDTMELRKKS